MTRDGVRWPVGSLVYGSVFIVAVPITLGLWSIRLDQALEWPVPQWPGLALGLAFAGVLIMLRGMLDLYHHGHGLPMNLYPPTVYVTQGAYALISHPIYLGAILLSAGVSLGFQSSSGLYLITPLLGLMAIALVLGYERLALRKRFGEVVADHQPVVSLPTRPPAEVAWTRRVAILLAILLPWLFIRYLIDFVRCEPDCSGAFGPLANPSSLQNAFRFLWFVPFLYLFLRMLRARPQPRFLSAAISAALAAAVGLYAYLVLPMLLPGLRENPWDVGLQFLIAVAALQYAAIWRALQGFCGWVANSRRDWLFFRGSFRIINHSLYVGLAGAVGVAILTYVIGNPIAGLLIVLSGLIGAALWAQFWWGSKALLRPFGYWGGILGGIIGIMLVHLWLSMDIGRLALAGVLGAPFGQAIGRLRCLAQGCCHGVVTDSRFGIRVWQPQSRVCVLSRLRGEWIHMTQLYSMLFNLMLGPLLWAIWLSGAVPVSFILGLYLILTGIERFAEDGYRGETQTRIVGGLLESQWVALAGLLLGICISLIPSQVAALAPGPIGPSLFIAAVVGGLMGAFAMGMDFPKSTLRFSRLSG